MQAGMTVTLHGLRARADVNGRTGVLAQWLEIGRWLVEMDGTLEDLRVKPENLMISACSRPLTGRSTAVDRDPAQLKAHFMAVVQKYGFNRGAKSDEVADYMTSREPGESAAVTCAAFAARLGTSEEEADAFLAWLNVGFACKERHLAQEGHPHLNLAQEPSHAPSLRTTPSRSASSEDLQAADAAAAAAPPAAASRASPAAGCGLRNVSAASKGCAAAVSAALRSPLLDDYIAE